MSTGPVTKVTIVIETSAAEFGFETNDEMHGVHNEQSITAGLVEVLRTMTERIEERGIEDFDGRHIISPGGVNVGRITIEREP